MGSDIVVRLQPRGEYARPKAFSNISYRISRENSLPSQPEFETELRRLDPIPWTEGSWQFAAQMIMPWNAIQNIGPHIDLVTNYLIRNYRQKIAA